MVAFKPKQLLVITLWAENIPETAHFYRDVIGLELAPHHGAQPTFIIGKGTYLLIKEGKPLPASNAERFPIIAFEVENLDNAVSHLESQGINCASNIVRNSDTKYVMFHDPAGNLLEFAQLSDRSD